MSEDIRWHRVFADLVDHLEGRGVWGERLSLLTVNIHPRDQHNLLYGLEQHVAADMLRTDPPMFWGMKLRENRLTAEGVLMVVLHGMVVATVNLDTTTILSVPCPESDEVRLLTGS